MLTPLNARDEIDFLPILSKDSYGGAAHVSAVLFNSGCFNHNPCGLCGSQLRLETYTKMRKTPDGGISKSTTTTLRCSNRRCHKTFSLFAGTIWNEIGNRQLFIYVVESFIARGTVREVANMTQIKEETISKYYSVIKNTLFAEVEEGRDSFIIGGQGVTVQADESHVFKRKTTSVESWYTLNTVGCLGWWRTFLTDGSSCPWLITATKKRCKLSSRNTSIVERFCSPTHGSRTSGSLITASNISW